MSSSLMRPGHGGLRSGRARALACLLLCAVLTACAGLSAKELGTLGSSLTEQKVDFASLSTAAARARAAYGTEAAIRKAYPDTVRVATPANTAVQYFIERDDTARIQHVVVRGSAVRKNLSEDFQARIHIDEATGLPLHSGFEADARAIYADAKPLLKPGYRNRFVGHSLGGAVVAILAIYAARDGYEVETVVTFGQPRFTTAKGVAMLTSLPLLRVVDENDIIPMLPPGVAGNDGEGIYEHAGPEVILLEGPHYVYLPSHDATRLGVGEFWRELSVAQLADHHMEKYQARLASKRSGAVQVDYKNRERYAAKPKPDAARAAKAEP